MLLQTKKRAPHRVPVVLGQIVLGVGGQVGAGLDDLVADVETLHQAVRDRVEASV